MCISSVTTVITVTTVIEKSDRAVTIGTIKIGAVLSYLAYLKRKDKKLFTAVLQQILFLFLPISLLTKCAYPFRAIPLLPTSVGAASIALWHPPQFVVQPCTPAGEPAPLASLAEEDDNKVCLPAKRQPISNIGIGTGNAPFSTLQVKVRRQSAGTPHFDEQSSACLRDYWQTG